MKRILIPALILSVTIFTNYVYSYYPMPFPQTRCRAEAFKPDQVRNNPVSVRREPSFSDEIVATQLGDVTADSSKELICFTTSGLRVLDGKTGLQIHSWNLNANYPGYQIDSSKNEGYRDGILYDVNHDRKLEMIFQIKYSDGNLLIVLNGEAKLLWLREIDSNYAIGLKILNEGTGNKVLISSGKQFFNAQTGALIKEHLELAAF